MVKVLCGKGPEFWIQEPYTEFEYRMYAAYSADSVRYRLKRKCITEATMTERDRQSLAEDPVPPFSAKERRRAEREYPDDYWLIEGETWPPRQDRVQATYAAVANATHITIGHARPLVPAGSPAAALPSAPADTPRSEQQAERPSRRQAR